MRQRVKTKKALTCGSASAYAVVVEVKEERSAVAVTRGRSATVACIHAVGSRLHQQSTA